MQRLMSMRFRKLLLILPAGIWLAVVVALLTGRQLCAQSHDDQPTGKHCAAADVVLNVTISPKTTYITKPLKRDGRPDYITVLNERLGRGVTSQNNAAVLLWKASGPSRVRDKDRKIFYQMLGMAPLPDNGDYYGHWSEYDSEYDYDRELLAMCRPWSKGDNPALARYLAANETPLALVVQASKRSRYYEPVGFAMKYCHDWSCDAFEVWYDKTGFRQGDLMYSYVGGVSPCSLSSMYGSSLVQLAMLKLHGKKLDKALDDLLACHRLVYLSNQAPYLNNIIQYNLNCYALRGDNAILQYGNISAEQAMNMANQLDKARPGVSLADKVDLLGRFVCLDWAIISYQRGLDELKKSLWLSRSREEGNGYASVELMAITVYEASLANVDWDAVLSTINSSCDQLAAALRKPTRTERNLAIEKFYKSLNTQYETRDASQAAISKRLGIAFFNNTLPPAEILSDLQDRIMMEFEIGRLGFAIVACPRFLYRGL